MSSMMQTSTMHLPVLSPITRIAHSPARTITAERMRSNEDDVELFFCHFCHAALQDVGKECQGCGFAHQGDGKYVNLGNASDQSCVGGFVVKGLIAITPPDNSTRQENVQTKSSMAWSHPSMSSMTSQVQGRHQLSKIFHLSIDSCDILPARAADRPTTVVNNIAQQHTLQHTFKTPGDISSYNTTQHEAGAPASTSTTRSHGPPSPQYWPTAPLSPGVSASNLKPLAPSANPQLQSSSYAVASQVTQQLMGLAGDGGWHTTALNLNGNMTKTNDSASYHHVTVQATPLLAYAAAPAASLSVTNLQRGGMTRAGSSGLLFDMDI